MTPNDGWELSEELRLLQETVRRFMANDVRPAEDTVEHDTFEMPADLLEPLRKKAKDLGIWCMRTPREFGGAGLNLLGQVVVAEEAALCRMGAYVPACGAIGADPPNVIFKGTPEQIERFGIPAVETGEKSFVAITEAAGRVVDRCVRIFGSLGVSTNCPSNAGTANRGSSGSARDRPKCIAW